MLQLVHTQLVSDWKTVQEISREHDRIYRTIDGIDPAYIKHTVSFGDETENLKQNQLNVCIYTT